MRGGPSSRRWAAPREEREDSDMRRRVRGIVIASSLALALMAAGAASAQKSGGILKVSHFDSPASIAPLEEGTIAALRPTMGVFNNLVMYRQDVAQTSLQSIVPDLATSWSWNEDGTELTFPLRHGVKWHDGKPLPLQMYGALGSCCRANRPRSCASIRANPGTAISMR